MSKRQGIVPFVDGLQQFLLDYLLCTLNYFESNQKCWHMCMTEKITLSLPLSCQMAEGLKFHVHKLITYPSIKFVRHFLVVQKTYSHL